MVSGIRASLTRACAVTLTLTLLAAPVPGPRPATAATYLTDASIHAPPTSGAQAYYATSGVFGPDQSSFPGIGQTFVDPVFGSTIRRLTNEMGQQSQSEIYSKNGYFNADGSLVHHRSPSGHTIINTTSGQVVRSGVTFNYDSSFAPDDPDAWYYFSWGDTTLYKYSVASGTRAAVTTFPGALGELGGSVDWIDRSGRYMVLNVGGATRVYDRQSGSLYAGSIPSSYGGGGGWRGISPDGNYVITSTPPTSSHSWRIDHANKTVSTTPVLFWTLCGGHGDVMSASNGKTYFVTFDCNSTGSIYAADVSLPQSASNVSQQLSQNKKLVQLASWSDVDGHFSRVSKGTLQDWVFASVESGDDGFSSSVSGWRAYKQEILMMNVLTGEVRRLAHHRSRGLNTSYYAQPRVSSTWDGSVILWTSNFGYDGSGYADLYALRAGTTGGGTGTPALAVAFTAPAPGAIVSGSKNVTMTATGGSGSGYSYALRIDGTAVASSGGSYAWNTTTVANGAHTLSATVTDSAGATSTATLSVTVQNTAPTTPAPTVSFTNPASGATMTGTVTVSMSAAGGSGTGYAYDVKAGATRIYAGASNSFSWNSVNTPNGSVILTATVTDSAGRTGTATRTVTVSNTSTTSTDTTPPSVSITAPRSGVWTGNSIQLSAAASDNVGLARIDLWGAGKVIVTLPCSTTTCSGTTTWLTGPLPAGAYQVNAVAVDKAGNRTTSAPITIYKDATSPSYASGAPSGSSTSDSGGTLPSGALAVTNIVAASGNAYQVATLNPGAPIYTDRTYTATTVPARVTGAKFIRTANGDKSGTGGAFLSFTTDKPATVLVGYVASAGRPAWLASWLDSGLTLGTTDMPLRLYEQTFAAGRISLGGNGGAESMYVVVLLPSGSSQPPATAVITSPPPTTTGSTDTTPPSVSITSPPTGAWTGNSIDVSATASDNAAVKTIQLYGNGALFGTIACTGSTCSGKVLWLTGSLASGQHTVTAVATDTSGNKKTSAPVTINK